MVNRANLLVGNYASGTSRFIHIRKNKIHEKNGWIFTILV